MMMPVNKRLYKVISLLIKTVILFFSFCYIWQKISEANNTIDFYSVISRSDKSYLLIAILLLFVNWSFEALKWKLLISPIETISNSKALKSVFAGITVSIFTPSRVGEFVGRIFFLDKADKIQASLKSFLGSFMQLCITIGAGIAGYLVLEIYYRNFFQNKHFISSDAIWITLFGIIVLVGFIVIVYFQRDKKLRNYKKYIETITEYSASQLLMVFGLSLVRYIIFSVQYYLILKFFGVNAGTTILFSLIALTFFVTSVIPTFYLTEIAVRGATAVYFFSTISVDSTAIVASSLLLWIINLALPALVGSIFILNLKLVKD